HSYRQLGKVIGCGKLIHHLRPSRAAQVIIRASVTPPCPFARTLLGLCALAGWLCAWQSSQSGYTAAAGYVHEGKPDAAIPLLENLLAATPGDLRARNLLGIAL